jgi:hypothetical protein
MHDALSFTQIIVLAQEYIWAIHLQNYELKAIIVAATHGP